MKCSSNEILDVRVHRSQNLFSQLDTRIYRNLF